MINNDDLFAALADAWRRELLVSLLDDAFYLVPSLSGASREMAGASDTFLREYLSGSLEISGVDEQLLRTRLVHLPVLEGYGFVDWQRDVGVVTRGPQYDEIVPLLAFLDDYRSERRTSASAELLR